MNFTLDSCIAVLILTVSLTYLIHITMTVVPNTQHHYDDSLIILGRLLRYYDIQAAIYTNNSESVDVIMYSTISHLHSYYLVLIDPEKETVVLICGTPTLSSYLVSITIPGWNGTLNPRTLCFRVGVGG